MTQTNPIDLTTAHPRGARRQRSIKVTRQMRDGGFALLSVLDLRP